MARMGCQEVISFVKTRVQETSFAGALKIMVFFSFSGKEADSQYGRQQFCGYDCQPYSVNPQHEGQEENGGNLENEAPQERNSSGDHTVVQRCKESRAPYVNPHQ